MNADRSFQSAPPRILETLFHGVLQAFTTVGRPPDGCLCMERDSAWQPIGERGRKTGMT
jgi:hypothetical protein